MDPAQDTSAPIAADNANTMASTFPVTAYLGINASVTPESIQSIQEGVVISMKSFMADWLASHRPVMISAATQTEVESECLTINESITIDSLPELSAPDRNVVDITPQISLERIQVQQGNYATPSSTVPKRTTRNYGRNKKRNADDAEQSSPSTEKRANNKRRYDAADLLPSAEESEDADARSTTAHIDNATTATAATATATATTTIPEVSPILQPTTLMTGNHQKAHLVSTLLGIMPEPAPDSEMGQLKFSNPGLYAINRVAQALSLVETSLAHV